MTKKCCDNCGRELRPEEKVFYVCLSEKPTTNAFGLVTLLPEQTEFCASCANQLRLFLKGGKK